MLGRALVFAFIAAAHAPALALLRRPVHDTLLGSLPTRMWVSDLLHAGDWPFWFPNVRYGLPAATFQFMADRWSPLALLLGATLPYQVWTLALEHVLWQIVGASGAFLFARRHVRSSLGAAAVACCYAGSGLVVPAVATGAIFPGLMAAPWLLAGIDRAIGSTSWREWCGATGLLALAAAVLVSSGYPGTWLTAPFLIAPFVLCIAGPSLRALGRGIAAALVAGVLCAGMVSLFLWETLTFPLFGGQPRNPISPFTGVLQPQSLFGLWLANPSYAPGLDTGSLQPVYAGLLSVVALCARCAPWGQRLLRPLRPLLLTAGGVLVVAAALTADYAGAGSGGGAAGASPDPLAAILHALLPAPGMAVAAGALFAAGAFPRRLGRWQRADVALAITALVALLAAAPTPLGDWLRLHVPPFTFIRWNWLYLWPAMLALPLLAWRTLEQVAPCQGQGLLPPVRERLRAWGRLLAGAAGLVASISLVAIAGAPEPPSWPQQAYLASERIGTVILGWVGAILLVGLAGLGVSLWRGRDLRRPAVWLGATAVLLLAGALLAGWLVRATPDQGDGLVRSFTFLPARGRFLLDLAQQVVVLGAGLTVLLRAQTRQGLARGLALVAVLDVALAGPRYMSDNVLMVVHQGPATVQVDRSLGFAGRTRLAEDAGQPIPNYGTPTMQVWTDTVPHVAEVDRRFGEPSIFTTFAHFPSAWTHAAGTPDVYVTPADLGRPDPASPDPGRDAPGTRSGPRCPTASDPRPAPDAVVTRLLSSVVRLEVVVDCERLLVYTDTWAPGWQVRIDGQPAQALRVNGAIRGVIVPAGRHTVEWRYRPVHLPLWLAIMGASFAISVALLLARFGRWRRSTAEYRRGKASVILHEMPRSCGVGLAPPWWPAMAPQTRLVTRETETQQ